MNPRPSPNKPSPEGPPGAPVHHWIRFRLGFVYVCFVVYFGFIGFRLVQLQVLINPELELLAQKQFQRVGRTSPHRLSIYDRNREELAVSLPSSSLFARPRLIRSKEKVARALSEILGGSREKWLKRLDSTKSFVWIQRQVDEDKAHEIVRRRLSGIFIETESKRQYPGGSLAASVLGFTDIDGNGISGLEHTLNEELLRKGTQFQLARDGKGNPSYLSKKYFREDDGRTGVYVTLDRRLQHALEEELERAQEETGAKSVMAAVMDPFTGEIFAIGQTPGFDPNHSSDYPADRFTNHVLSHLYEPGSTMKTILAAEALQLGLLDTNSLIDCEQGHMKVGGTRINEAEADHKFGRIPLEKVIHVSSNVGAVKVAQTLGVERVRAALDKFGLTQKTGINLPGEAFMPPRGEKFWRPLALANVGFGQGISATPLQMLSAYAPFANGGYLVRPRILLRENVSNERLEVRRVLSPATVAKMRQILLGVTEAKGGTGSLARIPNIRVAGKTGTAQKYEAGVGYNSQKYFSSFIGFLPANRPELLVGVFLDEPTKAFYAPRVAAPLFRRIAERALQILDRLPKKSIAQTDANTSPLSPDSVPPLPILVESGIGQWTMPDLKGLSVREALRLVGKQLDNVRVSGNGYLATQSPAAGARIEAKTPVVLEFSPRG